jgi:hypothetical protein
MINMEMVNSLVSSYAILEIYSDSLILKGYGNQEDTLPAK